MTVGYARMIIVPELWSCWVLWSCWFDLVRLNWGRFATQPRRYMMPRC